MQAKPAQPGQEAVGCELGEMRKKNPQVWLLRTLDSLGHSLGEILGLEDSIWHQNSLLQGLLDLTCVPFHH